MGRMAVSSTPSRRPTRSFISSSRTDGRSTSRPATRCQAGAGSAICDRVMSSTGAPVVSAELVPYRGGATFDLLTSAQAGTYWANGILLASILAPVGSASAAKGDPIPR